ncbi:hypothetical protein [Oerskovia flava]|uniref:hypothetical protein n=1 Tax=Oerskovia flava TaxID=2986422 RepID=UPI0022406112|nr:hypothetical protein [Oerskovia sp. JB1-3-2]
MTNDLAPDGAATDTPSRAQRPAARPTTSTSATAPRTRRAWAWTGVAGGVLGLVSVLSSMMLGMNWEATAGDPDAIVADLGTRLGTLLIFHTATAAAAVLVLVYGAGLSRRLGVQAPAGSLLPTVAGWGLVLVSVAGLLGSGLDTQFMFAFADPEFIVPESGAFYSEWVATIPWLWLGAGVSAAALAVAALRHAAAPRWIGVVSVVVGGITLVAGLSPLQYLAGFTGPVWLAITALGFALGDRR